MYPALTCAEGALGEELLSGALEVTQGRAEAHNVVLELERSGPLHIEALNTIDSRVLDGGGDSLWGTAFFDDRGGLR